MEKRIKRIEGQLIYDLEKIKNEQKMNIPSLAVEAKISDPSVRNFFKRNNSARLDIFLRIVDALGCRIEIKKR